MFKVRAERRFKQLQETQPEEAAKTNLTELEKEIAKRDEDDSTRSVAPLKRAKDAFYIDTTNLSLNEVVDLILKRHAKILEKKKKMKPAWARAIKMTFAYRICLFLAWSFFKIFYKCRVYGLEHFYEGGAIIAPNHVSYYDPPITSVLWPQAVHFLARETLFRSLFGVLIRKLNAHPVKGEETNLEVVKLGLQTSQRRQKSDSFS